MADVFISYSKQEPGWTHALASDLEARGYTTWWDTRLLPNDGFFPKKIEDELRAAKAVIVIWSESSVKSEWVYAEAQKGDAQGKLILVRTPGLDMGKVPLPFGSWQTEPITNREKVYAALRARGVTPNAQRQEKQTYSSGMPRTEEHPSMSTIASARLISWVQNLKWEEEDTPLFTFFYLFAFIFAFIWSVQASAFTIPIFGFLSLSCIISVVGLRDDIGVHLFITCVDGFIVSVCVILAYLIYKYGGITNSDLFAGRAFLLVLLILLGVNVFIGVVRLNAVRWFFFDLGAESILYFFIYPLHVLLIVLLFNGYVVRGAP